MNKMKMNSLYYLQLENVAYKMIIYNMPGLMNTRLALTLLPTASFLYHYAYPGKFESRTRDLGGLLHGIHDPLEVAAITIERVQTNSIVLYVLLQSTIQTRGMQPLKPMQEVIHENVVPLLGVTPSLKEYGVSIFIAHTLLWRVVNEEDVGRVNGRPSSVIGE